MRQASLSAEEKLRAAHAYLVYGVEQHVLAMIFGVNSGRIAEAVKEVRIACGFEMKVEGSGDDGLDL
jgi:hypothetical protein